MNYYQILPEKKLPIDTLTYKSDKDFIPGQIVLINIRNTEVFGVVISQNNTLKGDLSNIKPVSGTFPYILSSNQMDFIKNMANNTFNSPNILFESVVNPIKVINQKNTKNLSESIYEGQNITDIENKQGGDKRPPNLEFILDSELLIRIRNIIRISISSYLKLSYKSPLQDINILVVFPEKKILDNFTQNKENFTFPNLSTDANLINIYKYKAERRKSDQETIINIIKTSPYFSYTNQDSKQRINIILSTKAGIFLPFSSINKIILVDESNSFYIQEQNSLYYDTRDACFLLSKSFNCDLDFISTLPSIRLSNFYSESVLNKISTNYSQNNKKLPRIKIYEKNFKNDKFKVISNQILDILNDQEDINEIFTNE